jgi:CheY-like chemotaxis protein
VLVVDDEPRVGSSVKRVLGNHHVRCFTRARDALEVLRGGEAFDVILCDLIMPEMNGVELYRELEGTPSATRIVFMTGGAYLGPMRELLDGVPNATLEKPIDVWSLRDLIDRSVGASPQR